MGSVANALMSELAAFSDPARSSALAVTAIDLARRLDSGPGDQISVLLARELRLTLGELYVRAQVDETSDVERFLERISNPAFRGPGD
jgi:hypothetical protein